MIPLEAVPYIYHKYIDIPPETTVVYAEWDVQIIFSSGSPGFTLNNLTHNKSESFLLGESTIGQAKNDGWPSYTSSYHPTSPTPYPTTDGFHTYRLELGDNKYRIYQDRILVEEGEANYPIGTRYRVTFGVGSSLFTGKFRVDEIRFGTDSSLGGGFEATQVAPVADAGENQLAVVGNDVCLAGSGSDANGDSITYSWAFTSTPTDSTVALNATDIAMPCFTVDMAGIYIATLTVNDGTADSTPNSVSITVTDGPSTDCTGIQAALDDANLLIDQLMTQLTDLNVQLDTQTNSINDLTLQSETLQQQVNNLVNENTALNQDLNAVTEHRNLLQSQVTTLSNENADLTQQNSDLQNELDLLNNTVISAPIAQLENQLGITIPGATPAEQLTNLMTVMQGLNRGRLQGIINAFK